MRYITRNLWCPGPESNRHGESTPRDFRTRYSFRCYAAAAAYLGSGLSLYPILASRQDVGRSRQVSTLSSIHYGCSRLSSGLPPPIRAEVSPNLTPFTPGVSSLGAQTTQVPCVYQFRHPGKAAHADCTGNIDRKKLIAKRCNNAPTS